METSTIIQDYEAQCKRRKRPANASGFTQFIDKNFAEHRAVDIITSLIWYVHKEAQGALKLLAQKEVKKAPKLISALAVATKFVRHSVLSKKRKTHKRKSLPKRRCK